MSRPPDEVPDNDYPMVLSTGRVLEHWHTGAMTRRAAVLDAIEPEAIAFLNPNEIGRRNLTPRRDHQGRDPARRASRSGSRPTATCRRE